MQPMNFVQGCKISINIEKQIKNKHLNRGEIYATNATPINGI